MRITSGSSLMRAQISNKLIFTSSMILFPFKIFQLAWWCCLLMSELLLFIDKMTNGRMMSGAAHARVASASGSGMKGGGPDSELGSPELSIWVYLCCRTTLHQEGPGILRISVEDPVTLSVAPMSIPSSWRWSCGVAEWISSSGAEIMQGQAPDRRDTFSAPTAATHVSRVWSCSKWKVLAMDFV